MRLRHIEIFQAIRQTGSISAAAQLLHVSQPAVTKVLQHAEQQLGFPLFLRVRGKLQATPEALELEREVDKVTESLQGVRRLAQSLRREPGHSLRIGIDMRYAGQAFELTIWADPRTLDAASLRAMFEAEHRTRYGYARAALTVQVVAYRLRLTQASGSAVTTPLPTGQDLAREEVTVTLGGKRLTAVSMARDALQPGASVAGPAILAEPTSTTFVPDGWQAECLPTGDLMLKDLRQ